MALHHVGPLIQQVLNTVNFAGGQLSANGGLLSALLANPLFTALGLGGGLPVDVTATLNGVTSAPIRVVIR